MRYLLAAIFFTFTLSSQAEIFEAWDFAIDGDVQNNIALFESARAIQEKAGAHVEYWQHDAMVKTSLPTLFGSRIFIMGEVERCDANQRGLVRVGRGGMAGETTSRDQPAMNNLFDPTAELISQTDQRLIHVRLGTQCKLEHHEADGKHSRSVAISDEFGIATSVYVNGPSSIFYIFNMGSSLQTSPPSWKLEMLVKLGKNIGVMLKFNEQDNL